MYPFELEEATMLQISPPAISDSGPLFSVMDRSRTGSRGAGYSSGILVEYWSYRPLIHSGAHSLTLVTEYDVSY